GAGHPGYPLKQTTTMQVQGRSFTTESEVVELTSNPLDAAMFEMPAGCQVVGSYQELLGMGGMPGGVARGGQPAPAPEAAAPPAPEASAQPAAPPAAAAPPAPAAAVVAPKGEGVIRVGVVRINDATGTNLPLDNLRVNLMSEVTARQMEAVPLDAAGQAAIAAEAADKQCDYILYTEASQVAEPGSSIPLPAALRGVQLSKDKYQALLAVTLYRVGKPVPELKQTPLAADAGQFGVNAVMAGFEKEADKIADQVKKDTSKPARTTAPGKKPAPPKKPG
ncbi:MAG TPA: hypothetical protein VLW65_08695, partial [Bryobacteraceae bacterium]|nr:hypothetical protein [Bryobacteraceae bacterium]